MVMCYIPDLEDSLCSVLYIYGQWGIMLAAYSQIVQKIKKTLVLSCSYSVNLRFFQSKIKHLCACTHTFLSSGEKPE